MTDLNAIRARLGSISPASLSKLPKAVQTLLREDLPRLVEVAECAAEIIDEFEFRSCGDDLRDALASLLPPSPEQQIKEMPW